MKLIRTETEGRQWLAQKLRGMNVVLQPIESASTSIGIPDLYYVLENDAEGWIELKQVKATGAKVMKVPFRPGQLPWIKRHVAFGGIALLLVFAHGYVGGETVLYAFKGEAIDESIIDPDKVACFVSDVEDVTLSDLYRMLRR